MRLLLRAAARLENHWIGDVIGVVSLFGIFGMVMFLMLIVSGTIPAEMQVKQ